MSTNWGGMLSFIAMIRVVEALIVIRKHILITYINQKKSLPKRKKIEAAGLHLCRPLSLDMTGLDADLDNVDLFVRLEFASLRIVDNTYEEGRKL